MTAQFAYLLQVRVPDGVPMTFLPWIKTAGDAS
jgi:hypothetical protein